MSKLFWTAILLIILTALGMILGTAMTAGKLERFFAWVFLISLGWILASIAVEIYRD